MKIELNIKGITHTAEVQSWKMSGLLKYFGFNETRVFPSLEEIIELIGFDEFVSKIAKILSKERFTPAIEWQDLHYVSPDTFSLNANIGDLLVIVYSFLKQSTDAFVRISEIDVSEEAQPEEVKPGLVPIQVRIDAQDLIEFAEEERALNVHFQSLEQKKALLLAELEEIEKSLV
jgi:hypothetical protein